MRRFVVLALLYGAMQVVLPLGSGSTETRALLTFGFLVLAAYSAGELATAVRLPLLVGYLVAGLAFGPSVLGTLSASVLDTLAPVSSLAIALIAFLAGAELRWSEVKEHGVGILKVMSTELTITFVAIAATVYVLHDFLPFLSGAPPREALAFAVLFASIAIVHSPAVTLALLTETDARGPVARTALGVVLLADVAVVIFFSGSLAFARALVPPVGGVEASLTSILWEIGGAVLVGAALGGVTALYLRFVKRELFIFAILIAYFGAEIAHLVHVEGLLTLLIAGFVTENVGGGDGQILRKAMERAAAPVFVVFFALAGAAMAPREVAKLWPLVVPLVLVRAGGIWLGSRLGARWAGVSEEEQRDVWTGLIAQAGVAIGLVAVVVRAYPNRGEQLQTLFLAVLAVNQLAGPVLFRRVLMRDSPSSAGDTDATNGGTPKLGAAQGTG